jgi:hypothetical protein
MGHSSIKTTLDTYGHLFASLNEGMAEGLDGLFLGTVRPVCGLPSVSRIAASPDTKLPR